MEIRSLHDGAQFDDIAHFAVAVARLKKAKAQTHCGILFKDADGNVKLLDLAWHRIIRCIDPDDRYIWLKSPLDDLTQQHIATFAQMVFEKYREGGILSTSPLMRQR